MAVTLEAENQENLIRLRDMSYKVGRQIRYWECPKNAHTLLLLIIFNSVLIQDYPKSLHMHFVIHAGFSHLSPRLST